MRRYIATIAGKQYPVEIEALEDGKFRLKALSRTVILDALPTDRGLSLLIDGRSVDADLREEGKVLLVTLQGQDFPVEIEDARRLSLRPKSAKMSGKVSIKAPMPGQIARILVEEGSEVKERQGVVVVEAMKMENELRSPKDGKVIWVLPKSRVGSAVERGEELAVIE